MSYEMTVGLVVTDQDSYARYRSEMRPLLEEAGGAFQYDFDVARTLSGDGAEEVNRLFVLRFPSESNKDRFFADPRYVEIKSRLFDPAVKQRVFISEHVTDG